MKEIEMPNGGKIVVAEKGESGNPNGRPKGVKSFKRILKELLKENTTITDITGEIKTLTKKEAGILLLVRDATNEDEDPNVRMKALNMVMEKIDGKPVAKAEVKHSGTISNAPDFSKLTDSELDAYLALCKKLKGGD